jgi:probable addiction module antidote protein
MPKKTRSFRSWQLEKLADPKRAASYLNASLLESIDQFLIGLGKVAQANQMTKVAKEAGIQRETLYRSFSEQGNPTIGTLDAVLKAVGLRISIEPNNVTEAKSSELVLAEVIHQDLRATSVFISTGVKFESQEIGVYRMYFSDYAENVLRSREKAPTAFGPLGVAIPPCQLNQQDLIWSSK